MSGRCVFNRQALHKMLDGVRAGTKGILSESEGIVTFIPQENGWIEIFTPPHRNLEYVTGADVSEGLENDGKDTDYSTGVVLDQNMIHCATLRCKFDPKIFKDELRKLAIYYNNALTGVERNKDGLGVLLGLEGDNYKNLYYQEEINPDKQIKEKKLGWTSDKVRKPLMISYLNELIKNELLHCQDRMIIEELTTYLTFANGSTGADSSCHDDLVIALGIACWIQKNIVIKVKNKAKKDTYSNSSSKQQGKVINGISGY
jgi:hypothetical protein